MPEGEHQFVDASLETSSDLGASGSASFDESMVTGVDGFAPADDQIIEMVGPEVPVIARTKPPKAEVAPAEVALSDSNAADETCQLYGIDTVEEVDRFSLMADKSPQAASFVQMVCHVGALFNTSQTDNFELACMSVGDGLTRNNSYEAWTPENHISIARAWAQRLLGVRSGHSMSVVANLENVLKMGHLEYLPGGSSKRLILGSLGKGGMGQVQLVLNLSSGRVETVKTVLDKLIQGDKEHFKGLLKREFDGMRSGRDAIKNEGFDDLVSVSEPIEFFEHEGNCCLVMEYVDGPTLSEKLKEHPGQPLPEGEAYTIGTGLAAAVTAFGENGQVHRDLKPDNIIIDKHGKPVILDFGLIHALIKNGSLDGRVAGTPVYMSPEQAAGEEAAPHFDVYALGLLLAEIFSGFTAHQRYRSRKGSSGGPTNVQTVLAEAQTEEFRVGTLANDLRQTHDAADVDDLLPFIQKALAPLEDRSTGREVFEGIRGLEGKRTVRLNKRNWWGVVRKTLDWTALATVLGFGASEAMDWSRVIKDHVAVTIAEAIDGVDHGAIAQRGKKLDASLVAIKAERQRHMAEALVMSQSELDLAKARQLAYRPNAHFKGVTTHGENSEGEALPIEIPQEFQIAFVNDEGQSETLVITTIDDGKKEVKSRGKHFMVDRTNPRGMRFMPLTSHNYDLEMLLRFLSSQGVPTKGVTSKNFLGQFMPFVVTNGETHVLQFGRHDATFFLNPAHHSDVTGVEGTDTARYKYSVSRDVLPFFDPDGKNPKDWLQQALAELGQEATVNQIFKGTQFDKKGEGDPFQKIGSGGPLRLFNRSQRKMLHQGLSAYLTRISPGMDTQMQIAQTEPEGPGDVKSNRMNRFNLFLNGEGDNNRFNIRGVNGSPRVIPASTQRRELNPQDRPPQNLQGGVAPMKDPKLRTASVSPAKHNGVILTRGVRQSVDKAVGSEEDGE